MRNETINGHKFVFYDSIENLPILQFHKYGKYMLVQSGIGDSPAHINQHINRILQFIGKDDKKAVSEVLNLRRCLFAVANETDLAHKGFLFFVKSVDGKDWTDYTDSGIDELFTLIWGESNARMWEIETKAITLIDSQLEEYFPKIFADSVTKNYTELLRKQSLLYLSEILDDKDNTKEIDELEQMIVGYIETKNFEGENNEEIAFDKNFEQMCLCMSKEFGGIIKNYSVMEFYSAYERLKQEAKEMEKRRKK